MYAPTNHVWRLTPVARADDPRWQGRRIWSELVIVAGNVGEAVLLAARHDEQASGYRVSDSQDGQQLRSGFEDELLYRADRLEATAPAGARAGHVIHSLCQT
jgi:hypothetical protein